VTRSFLPGILQQQSSPVYVTTPFTATSAGGSSAAGTFTVSTPTGDTIGTNDVVIVAVSLSAARSITTPSGWTVLGPLVVDDTFAYGNKLHFYWCRGTPSTWVFTLSASTTAWAYACDVLRGVIPTTSTPYRSTDGGTAGTDTSAETGTLSGLDTWSDTCLAVAVAGWSDTGGTRPTTWGSAPAGWTNRATATGSTNGYGVVLATSQLSGSSLASATWTMDDTPQNWQTRVLAFSAE
jgi:hypothetical protein